MNKSSFVITWNEVKQIENFLSIIYTIFPQGTSEKIWDFSSQPKLIKTDVQHNLGFDTKMSTLSIATVGTSGMPEQAPSDFQNIT